MKFRFNPIVDNRLAYFPKKYANQAILFYLIALAACSVLFLSQALPLFIFIMGVASVVLFFLGSNRVGEAWSRYSEKTFIKKVFWTGFWIRVVFALFILWYNNLHYDSYWESDGGDIGFYVPTAFKLAKDYGINIFQSFQALRGWRVDISDMGYICYLQVLAAILNLNPSSAMDSVQLGHEYVWIFLMFKAVYGSVIAILMYRIAQRHFGENVARMTAIFCMLQWNMIWWCGSMMKETEMILISCLFAERMDKTMMGLNLKPWYIAGTIAIGLLIFTFRSALFMTAFAATVLALTLTRTKTLTSSKKFLAGLMIAAAMSVAVGDNIMREMQSITQRAQSTGYQKTNMEWRSTRTGGNEFAKYASAAVFAPLIFTIPFPNMVYTQQGQEMLMMVNGGNFAKNVLSFFIIFAMFQLLISGQWRQHVFPLAYYVGYLAALTLSVFAQSGRFHMPIFPFAMMFGAYGLTLVTSRKHKQWFIYALIVEVVICIGWSWFKLKGRGMI